MGYVQAEDTSAFWRPRPETPACTRIQCGALQGPGQCNAVIYKQFSVCAIRLLWIFSRGAFSYSSDGERALRWAGGWPLRAVQVCGIDNRPAPLWSILTEVLPTLGRIQLDPGAGAWLPEDCQGRCSPSLSLLLIPPAGRMVSSAVTPHSQDDQGGGVIQSRWGPLSTCLHSFSV